MAPCRRPIQKNGSETEERFRETCLVDAFRSLGVKVSYSGHGPFWALADGAKMLEPLGQFSCH